MIKNSFLLYSLTTSYAESCKNNNQFVHILNREFVNLGINVKTITPHKKNLKTLETLDGVLIKRFRYLPKKNEIEYAITDELKDSKLGFLKIGILTIVFFIFTFKECINEKPDFFHGHWAFPGGYIAYIMSKIFGKRFIVTIHGGEIALLKKFKFLKKIVIGSLNKSSAVIANSNYTKTELEKLGVESNKIKIIKVPFFSSAKKPDDDLKEFRKKFVEPQFKIILFVGRLSELKGTRYLIEALPLVKNEKIHVIIAGDGPELYSLKKIVNELNLKNKVTFFGWANSDEVNSLYNISDVLVFPSIIDSRGSTEGLGLVIPEAMNAGLPVITSSVGGIIDIVKDRINGILVNPKDSKSIALAIEKIFSDNDLKEKIVSNSKKIVNEFSPSKIAQEYHSDIQRILKNDS